MKRVYKAPALILIVIFLSGCWDQNVFEKIGFIITQGMDLGTENNTLVTFALPIISQGESSNGSSGGQGNEVETKTEVNDTEAYLAREARDIGRQASHKQLEGGKIQ
ncbi:MAG: spore gernimation protein GerC, partial [Clostridiales bacterium]|nr:spore gernimation protein GerC [Clostridiales bacterium]